MRIKLLLLLLITTVVAAVSLTYATNTSSHAPLGVSSFEGRLEGKVLDAAGQPVSDAEVYALKSDFSSGKVPTAFTDEDGVFAFVDLQPGTYLLSVAKEESWYPNTRIPFYSAGFIQPFNVNVYEHQTTSDVLLYMGPKAAKLIGEIVDTTTGKSVKNLQGTQINLRRTEHSDSGLTTGPDPAGKFNVLVPPAPFAIEVSVAGYKKWSNKTHPLTLSPGTDHVLKIPLTPDR